MKIILNKIGVLFLLAFMMIACKTNQPKNTNYLKKNVLVFTKTEGFRHTSISDGVKAVQKLAQKNNWDLIVSENADLFNDNDLKKYGALLFLNTTGNILNTEQENAFIRYIHNGGGFVGIHAAADTEKDWDFYVNMLGASFKSHPKQQKATLVVNKSCPHLATAHFPEKFEKFDEWYNFKKPVANYVNILLSLDESSYKGKQMKTDHPISWYHTYEGGRVFYTGMGHTSNMYTDVDYLKHIEAGINWAVGNINVMPPKNGEVMLDRDLSKWDVWIGVPHISVVNLNAPKFENVMKGGIPLGLNNDPKKVFSTIEENGETILKVTGEIYGGLTTKNEYENYHFRTQFKWGAQQWEPRLKTKRDNGILYHAVGPHGVFWNTWMACLEFQVQEGDCGDFFPLGGMMGDVPASEIKLDNGKIRRIYNPKSKELFTGMVKRSTLHENPNGEWNTLDLYVLGDESIHVVNGYVVNRIKNARREIYGKMKSIIKGKIQIQSEAAEVYYKNMKITPIHKFSSKFKKF